MSILTFSNDGQKLVSTNYWDSDHAKRGMMYLSFNAGAGRLLVPTSKLTELSDMRTAKHVVMTRGLTTPERRDAVELMFEDDSTSPWVVTIGIEECYPRPLETDRGRTFPLLVYTLRGLEFETEVRYRRTLHLPCLKPWR